LLARSWLFEESPLKKKIIITSRVIINHNKTAITNQPHGYDKNK